MAPRTTSSSKPQSVPFSVSAADVLHQLQSAMAELLFGAGLDGARSTDIGRILGLDKTLAWKVTRLVRESDPLAAARHLPGASGVRILLEAAASAGATAERIDAVRQADAEFRRFVEERAGDLRTFEAMLTGTRRDAKSEFEQRRTYYQSGAAIWGVRASAQFLMLALCPSHRQPGMLDVVQTGGFVRLERLKPNTPWIIRRLLTTTDDAGQHLSFERVPLDPAAVSAPAALPLLREFCSDPPPQIRQFQGHDGFLYDEVLPGPLGPSGAVTVVTGEIYRAAVSAERSEENQYGRYKLSVRTPLEYVQFDVLVHRSLTNFEPMIVATQGLLEGRPSAGNAAEYAEQDASAAPAKRLGAPPVLKTTRIEAYDAIARRALELAGQSPDDFTGYRAAMDFPTAPSEMILSCTIG